MVGYGKQRFQLAPWEVSYNQPKKQKKKPIMENEVNDSQTITDVPKDGIWQPNVKKFNLKI